MKVITDASPVIGSNVVVTGASSCYIPTGETHPVRQIRAISVVDQ